MNYPQNETNHKQYLPKDDYICIAEGPLLHQTVYLLKGDYICIAEGPLLHQTVYLLKGDYICIAVGPLSLLPQLCKVLGSSEQKKSNGSK